MEPENLQKKAAGPVAAGGEMSAMSPESSSAGILTAAAPAFNLGASPAQRQVVQRVEDPLSDAGIAAINGARGEIDVETRSEGDFGFIHPRALAFVPHDPDARGGNPRHNVFGDLARALGRVNQIRISSSASPSDLATATTALEATVTAARAGMVTYLRGHTSRITSMVSNGNLPAGATLDTALAEIAAMPMTQEQHVTSYNIEIEGRTIRLLPVVPLNDDHLDTELAALRAQVRTLRAQGRTLNGILQPLIRARTRAEGRLRSLPAAPNRRFNKEQLEVERTRLTTEITNLTTQITAAQTNVDANTTRVNTANERIEDVNEDIGEGRERGLSAATGTLIERPGGYVSGNSARATPDLIASAVSGFSAMQQRVATDYINVIFRAEGNPASLNTWDRLRITLGSGLGAAGVLQRTFLEFFQSNPADFERLFGRYGIGVTTPTRAARNPQLTVVDPGSRTMLVGTPATEYIANNPALLAVLVNAGHDEAWQLPLIAGSTGSVSRALATNFTVGTQNINLYALLDGHVPYATLARSMFALADDIHGGGSVDPADLTRLSTTYSALATEHGFDPLHPENMPDAARLALATAHIAGATHPNRRRHIDNILEGT